jgi:hypothetical protein
MIDLCHLKYGINHATSKITISGSYAPEHFSSKFQDYATQEKLRLAPTTNLVWFFEIPRIMGRNKA